MAQTRWGKHAKHWVIYWSIVIPDTWEQSCVLAQDPSSNLKCIHEFGSCHVLSNLRISIHVYLMYSYISEANQDKCGFWIGHIHIHVQLPNYSQTENQSSQVQVKSTFSFEVWFEIEKDQTCNVLRDATSEPLTGWDTNKSLRRVNWWVQHFITAWVHFDKICVVFALPFFSPGDMSKNMSNHMIVAWCEGSIERWLHYWNHNRKRQLNLGHKKLPRID